MNSKKIADADRYIERLEEANEILRQRISEMEEQIKALKAPRMTAMDSAIRYFASKLLPKE